MLAPGANKSSSFASLTTLAKVVFEGYASRVEIFYFLILVAQSHSHCRLWTNFFSLSLPLGASLLVPADGNFSGALVICWEREVKWKLML